MARRSLASELRRVASAIATTMAEVYDDLDGLAEAAAVSYAVATEADEPWTTSQLAGLRPTIHAILARHGGFVTGAGVIAAPAVLDDAAYFLEWWQLGPRDRPIPLRLGTDPSAPDFYDYTHRGWFEDVARTRRPVLDGPYVDLLGADVYTLTGTVPIEHDGRLLAVAGADLYLERFEEAVLPQLLQVPAPVALVNALGRVLVTTDASLGSGSLLVGDDLHAATVGDLPLRVLALDANDGPRHLTIAGG
jgi:hypothetical protein